MTSKDPRAYLWQNLCALIGVKNPSLDLMQERTGLGRGTCQRIRDGDTGTHLTKLIMVAERFNVEVWQLLAPDFDPASPPQIASHAPRWPFDIEIERFDALLPKEQGMVEHAARIELERIEARHRASDGEPQRPFKQTQFAA